LVLLGHPVAHSLSPAIQNAALKRAGLPITYEAVDVPPPELGARIAWCLSERVAGNVTVPHKEAVADACSSLTPVAKRAAAANVFWVERGALMGDNTDVPGFLDAAATLLGEVPVDARVAVLGAGGSAAAVLLAITQWPGARARVWARSLDRAAALCSRFPDMTSVAATPHEAARDATIVVNATPIGLTDDSMPLDPSALPPTAAAIDLVYRRAGTAWVRALRARNHVATDGLPMLIAQGALAFKRWFGFEPDKSAMWDAARAHTRD